MELKRLEDKVSNLAEELELLEVYISSKFGLDFQQFRKSHLDKHRPSSSSNSKDQQNRRKRMNSQLGDDQTQPWKVLSSLTLRNKDSNEEECIHSAVIKIEDSSLDSFLGQDQELLGSDLELEEEESVMGVVLPEGGEEQDESSSDSDSEYEHCTTTTPIKRGRGRPRLKKKKKKKVLNPEKKTRKRYEWEDYRTFNSLEEAKTFVNTEEGGMFVTKGKYTSSEGDVYSYVCRKSHHCASKRKIFLCPNSEEVRVGRSVADHDHDKYVDVSKMKRGIQTNVQEEIKRLLVEQRDKKPLAILAALRKKGLELPTKRQLVNYLLYIRKGRANSKKSQANEGMNSESYLQFPEINSGDTGSC